MGKSQTTGRKCLHLLVALFMVTAGLLGMSTVTATIANAYIGGDPGGYDPNPQNGGSNCSGCTSGGWNGGGNGGWSSPFNGVAAWSEAQRTAKTAAARGIPSPIGTYRNLTLTSNGANVGQQLDQQYIQQSAPCQAPILYTLNPQTNRTEPSRWGNYPSNAVGVRWVQTKNWNSNSSQLIESNVSFNGCLIPASPVASVWKCPIKIDSVTWRGPYGKLVNTDDPKGQPTVVPYSSQPENTIPDANTNTPASVKEGIRSGTTTGWVYQVGKSPQNSFFAALWNGKTWGDKKKVPNENAAWNIIKSCKSIFADFSFNPAVQSNRSASATLSRSFGKDPIGLVGNYSYTATYKYVTCTKVSDGEYTAQVSTSNNTTTPRVYPAVTRYPANTRYGCPNNYNKLVSMSKTSGMQQLGMCTTSDLKNLPAYGDGRTLNPVPGTITSRGNPVGYPYEKALHSVQANYNYNAGWWGMTGNRCPPTTDVCTPGTGDPSCPLTTPPPTTPTPCITGTGNPSCPPTTPTPTPPPVTTVNDCTTDGLNNCICYYDPPNPEPTITENGKPISDNSQITAQGQKVRVSWTAEPKFRPGIVNLRNIRMSFGREDDYAYPSLSDGLSTNDPVKSDKSLNDAEIPSTVPAIIELQFFQGAALDKQGINADNLTPKPFQVKMTRTFTYDTTTTTRTYRYVNGRLTLVTSTTVSQPTEGKCPPLTATLTVLDTRVANKGG